MSYAPSQPASNSNGMLVMVTIGVCVASCLELVAFIIGYVLFAGGMFATRVAALHRLDQARAAQAEAQAQQARVRTPSVQPAIPIRSSPATSSSNNVPPAPAAASTYHNIAFVNEKDRVYILWKGSWWPGSVVHRSLDQVKIHYDNHDATWDEWVALDRLRRMSPTDPKYQVTPPPTSAGSTANLNPHGLTAPHDSTIPPQDYSFREWRNRSGEVIFRGQLYANYGLVVRLMNQSGYSMNSIPVDMSLLSESDQAYVRGFPVVPTDRPSRSATTETRAKIDERLKEMEERRKQREAARSPTPTNPPADTDQALKGVRTWTDSTGQHKLEAELIGVVDGNVQLKRTDGKISTMPVDKLSPADRALVRAKYPE